MRLRTCDDGKEKGWKEIKGKEVCHQKRLEWSHGPGTYTWLPVATAVQQLAQRLNDPTMQFWVYDELLTYISTSLRQFNSLTWMWRADFQYNDPVNIWNSLGSFPVAHG